MIDPANQEKTGLFERLEALSRAYQDERQELERVDLTILTIQAPT